MPKTLRLSSSAAVAELKQTNLLLYFAGFLSVSTSVLPVLIYAASLLSRSLTLGPVVIHPLLNVSMTSLISASLISGGEKGITLLPSAACAPGAAAMTSANESSYPLYVRNEV